VAEKLSPSFGLSPHPAVEDGPEIEEVATEVAEMGDLSG
jgi:hypothetical protein